MKKLGIAAIAIVIITAIAADINRKVVGLFTTSYASTTKAHYKTVRELASIDFLLHGTHMQAFYSSDSEQAGTSHTINYKNLPCQWQALLESRFKGYTAIEVIEMEHGTEKASYYVWLQKDEQQLIPRISMNGEMSIFKQAAQ